jgi:hypothetical protein
LERARVVLVDYRARLIERQAQGDTREVPYSRRYGATRTGLAEKTVERALEDLVGIGVLREGEPLPARMVDGRRWPRTRTFAPGPRFADAIEAAAVEPQAQVGDVGPMPGAQAGVREEGRLAAEVGVAPRGLLPVGGGIGPRHAPDPDDRGGRQ